MRGTDSRRCLQLVVAPQRDTPEICACLLALVRRWDERAARIASPPALEVYRLFTRVLERIVKDALMTDLDPALVVEASWRIVQETANPVKGRDLHPGYELLRQELETELDELQRLDR